MREVRVERLIPATPERVFRAWTDPATMARWLSPVGRAEAEADVRVGGAFRVTMIGDDIRIDHTGEYLAVEPPSLLRFTWVSPFTGREPSVVTVELSADGPATRLVLVHDWLPPDHVETHRDGWGTILDRLASVLAEEGSPA
jgi:uncharacterized protein YndB with AHSA1/START domain